MMKLCSKLVLLIIFCINDAFAAHLYQIDLIIFKHLHSKNLHSENWTSESFQPHIKDAIELKDSGFYSILPENKKGLRTEASILQNDPNYQVLLHVSWIQPAFSKKGAPWIHLSGGKLYDDHIRELEGEIRISQAQFFNIDTKLYLSLSQGAVNGMSLIENRQTKSDKLNYLDHPLLGALIQIVPIS